MSEAVIEARGLSKRYGGTVAVDSLDLEVEAGEVFGLLGPNGAGKTTTILMLLGMTDPSAGSVRVVGFDPFRQPLEVKRRVGYMPDSVGFYDYLSATENLRYTARLAGLGRREASDRIAAMLDRVGLADVADHRVSTYSRGMRQRLALAEILMKQVRLAILDEPTNGLDPQSTHEFLELVAELKGEGMTILLSSHMLGLVQKVCDRVALFNHGRIGLLGRVPDLAGQVLGGFFVIELDAAGLDLAEACRGIEDLVSVAELGPTSVRIEAKSDIRAELARRVVERGGALRRLAMNEVSLDDVYTRYFNSLAAAA
jgi:ABC-2 type transport system ATP-binding protein